MVTKEQVIDILEKFDFFQGQRAGRELWNDKPFDVQEKDINNFSRDVSLIKEYISDVAQKSEWISVEDRLPEDDFPKDTERRSIRCFVATNKGSVKACVRQRYILESTGELSPWCWSRDVFDTPTHWMPLPEPPKMKGGAE